MSIRRAGLGLNGDLITVKTGFDGWEHPRLQAIIQADPDVAMTRISFSLNTYYEEINGAFYFNKCLLSFFDIVFDAFDLFLVNPEYYLPSGFVPSEMFIGTEEEEPYFVCDRTHKIVGHVFQWFSCVGVTNLFYDDAILLEFLFFGCDVSGFLAKCFSLSKLHGIPLVHWNEDG